MRIHCHVLVFCNGERPAVLADKFVLRQDDGRGWRIDPRGKRRRGRQDVDATVGVAIASLDRFALCPKQVCVMEGGATLQAFTQVL
jgi:hypothetical protein